VLCASSLSESRFLGDEIASNVMEVSVHTLFGANVWIVLLFVAVATAALTFTAVTFLTWMKRQEEEELSPLHDIQDNLARMMQEAKGGPNGSAWV
jgi:hypothetical protein